MPSRMDRYYQTEVDLGRRTKKNQALYDDIHRSMDYGNVKQVSNANEISPEKLNEILNKEKKPQKRNLYDNVPPSSYVSDDEDDEKNYDVKEALEKAKNENTVNNNYHKLNDDQINLLKKIQNYKATMYDKDENLDELLNTIANTKLLKQLNDRDLSLDLLGDLKSNNENTIVGGINSINNVMTDIPKIKTLEDEKNEIDKSFYTSSLSFNENDFDDLTQIKSGLQKNHDMMKWVFIVLGVLMVISIIIMLAILL